MNLFIDVIMTIFVMLTIVTIIVATIPEIESRDEKVDAYRDGDNPSE